MKSKTKINLIIIAAIFIVVAMIYGFIDTKKWMSYSNPVEAKNIEVGIFEARDYPIDGKKSYYYKVVSNIKYSQDTWPNIKEEIIKSDTLLLLHDCSSDN